MNRSNWNLAPNKNDIYMTQMINFKQVEIPAFFN